MQKDRKRDHYAHKKFKEQKNKTQKDVISQEGNQLLKEIQHISKDKLQNFLEKKYDNIMQKNEKLAFKLNNAIAKRILQYPDQLVNVQKSKIKSLLQKQMIAFKQSDIDNFFSRKAPFLKMSQQQQFKWHFHHDNKKNMNGIQLTFNLNKGNTYYAKIRTDIPQKFQKSLHKRMKKQALQAIQYFKQYEKDTIQFQSKN